ncbi:MAG: hypothetical protein ACYC5O_00525 [Anaerolineae bacterium]
MAKTSTVEEISAGSVALRRPGLSAQFWQDGQVSLNWNSRYVAKDGINARFERGRGWTLKQHVGGGPDPEWVALYEAPEPEHKELPPIEKPTTAEGLLKHLNIMCFALFNGSDGPEKVARVKARVEDWERPYFDDCAAIAANTRRQLRELVERGGAPDEDAAAMDEQAPGQMAATPRPDAD